MLIFSNLIETDFGGSHLDRFLNKASTLPDKLAVVLMRTSNPLTPFEFVYISLALPLSVYLLVCVYGSAAFYKFFFFIPIEKSFMVARITLSLIIMYPEPFSFYLECAKRGKNMRIFYVTRAL